MSNPLPPRPPSCSTTACSRWTRRLRPLFKGEMGQQGQMLMSMIGSAVGGLKEPGKAWHRWCANWAPAMSATACSTEHYATVGSALLWTLEQGLGPKFTPDVRDAWTAAYTLLSDVMQLGAMEEEVAISG
jgi:hemoglobin-like flavoprotein